MDTAAVRNYLLGLQEHIVSTFEGEEGRPFLRDRWTREPGGRLEGEGMSQLVEGGDLLDRKSVV